MDRPDGAISNALLVSIQKMATGATKSGNFAATPALHPPSLQAATAAAAAAKEDDDSDDSTSSYDEEEQADEKPPVRRLRGKGCRPDNQAALIRR